MNVLERSKNLKLAEKNSVDIRKFFYIVCFFTGSTKILSLHFIRYNEAALSPQMAVNEMAIPEVGCTRNDLVAGFETVDTAGMEPAAGRYLGGTRDVSLKQDVFFLYRRICNGDVCQERLGVRV